MTFNLEKIGRPLATFLKGDNKGKIISVSTSPEEEKKIEKPYKMIISKELLQQIPNPNTEREVLYITGTAGCGKSTYIKNYTLQWKKKHKNGEVYIISDLDEDTSLDEIKAQRIVLDKRMYEDPLTYKDFPDSLVIFDDIDSIGDKKIKDAVYILLNQIIKLGRHENTTILISNHLPTEGNITVGIINGSNSVTYFPYFGTGRRIKTLLKDNIELSDKDIKKIKKTKSRWATIFIMAPRVVLTEHNSFLLDDDDDDDDSDTSSEEENNTS